MKIIIDKNLIPYKLVECGSIFTTKKDEGDFYIKTDILYKDMETFYSIRLRDGKNFIFNNNDKFIIVDSELHIK